MQQDRITGNLFATRSETIAKNGMQQLKVK